MTCHTYRCVLQYRHSNATPYIWISEKAISNSFRRFLLSREFRRDGSFTPGPMEARKRQAKRRMNDMANAGRTMLLEAEALTGMGLRRAQWDMKWEPPRQLEYRNPDLGQSIGWYLLLIDTIR